MYAAHLLRPSLPRQDNGTLEDVGLRLFLLLYLLPVTEDIGSLY